MKVNKNQQKAIEIPKVDMTKIEVRDSVIHGKGVFAAVDIKKGERIIEYVGEKVSKKEGDKRADEILEMAKSNPELGGVYVFELDSKYDIDGNVTWNPARLINHSCDPNCESENEDGHIYINAIKDIRKGEELSYDYGYDIDDYKDHPCKCGKENCVGYIVAEKHRKKLLENLKNQEN